MLIEQTPAFLRKLYPQALWRKDADKKTIYLTFDDGPVPGITPWVLDALKDFGIKATFFSVGDNVRKHPQIHRQTLDGGHTVGNHTFNHIPGSRWDYETFIDNVDAADAYINSPLFRPPHGHLTFEQYRRLKNRYQIVMWDIITRDYNATLRPEKVLNIVKRYTRNGSLIVFHDSLKAERNMKYAMPRAVEWLLQQGYTFDKL